MRFNVVSYSSLNANPSEWLKPSYIEEDEYNIIELKNQDGVGTKYQFINGYQFSAGNTNDSFPNWIEVLKLYVGNTNAFQELIDLSFDNQPIGSPVFTKLYNDFKEHQESVKEFAFSGKPDEHSYYHPLWYHMFIKWYHAFRISSENGIVITDIYKSKLVKKYISIDNLLHF